MQRLNIASAISFAFALAACGNPDPQASGAKGATAEKPTASTPTGKVNNVPVKAPSVNGGASIAGIDFLKVTDESVTTQTYDWLVAKCFDASAADAFEVGCWSPGVTECHCGQLGNNTVFPCTVIDPAATQIAVPCGG